MSSSRWSSDWSQLGRAIIRKVKLGNALDSPLVLTLTVAIIAITAFIFTQNLWLLVIVGILVTFFVVAFFTLLVKDPSLLRSEEHEERMMQLSVGLGEKNKEVDEAKIDMMVSEDASSNQQSQLGGGNKK